LDFLLDPNRSGKFVIKQHESFVTDASMFLAWHKLDVTYFHPHHPNGTLFKAASA
jgi:hypothetical protein